jgi:hypothetical protein
MKLLTRKNCHSTLLNLQQIQDQQIKNTVFREGHFQ